VPLTSPFLPCCPGGRLAGAVILVTLFAGTLVTLFEKVGRVELAVEA
jgi:hypothetical protein